MSLHSAGVWLLRLLGCLLIYAAVFLYEDEEGRVQNRVEQWRDKIGQTKAASVSKVTALMNAIAKLVSQFFDRMFGKHLFSARGAVVSVCYSIASFGLLVWVFPAKGYSDHPISALVVFVLFLFLGSVPGIFKEMGKYLWVWGVSIPAFIVCLAAWSIHKGTAKGLRDESLALMFLVGVFVVSFACDVIYIALTRWMLRKVAQLRGLFGIFGIILLNCMLGVSLAFGPAILGLVAYFISAGHKKPVVLNSLGVFSMSFVFVSGANAIDVIACSVFLVLLIFLACHRLVWPLLHRPLYAVARYGVIKRKGLLWAFGAVLVIGPDKNVAAWKWLIDKVSSLH